jgi:hypothetical protein
VALTFVKVISCVKLVPTATFPKSNDSPLVTNEIEADAGTAAMLIAGAMPAVNALCFILPNWDCSDRTSKPR